jgi:16S rRNA (cytidine1402-2'-O)-methyltransferase
VAREISKTFEETVTGTLEELAGRYAEAPPKGEIVIIVAPPGEPGAAAEGDVDAALLEALTRLPPAKAAGEVAKAFGVDRRDLYARAMAIKSGA